jgi:hypothetical protein
MKQIALRFAVAALVLAPASVFAQDKPADPATPATTPDQPPKDPQDQTGPGPVKDPGKPEPTPGEDPAAKKKLENQDKFGTTEEEETAGAEKPTSKYYLGARFRDFIAPGFIFNWFADGGPDVVNVFSGGPEFALQSGNLEVIFSVTVPYADFSMNEFVFKSKDDGDEAYEIVSSSLKLITVSVDLLGRIPLERKGTVALLVGGGAGISGVLGDIFRNQAYPDDPNNIDPKDPAKWSKCRDPGDPDVRSTEGKPYCGADNDHYGDYVEPSWVNGGSKPVVFPYLALPHIGVEVVPIEQFLIRLDTGFSITGFFFGLGAGGKLPI